MVEPDDLEPPIGHADILGRVPRLALWEVVRGTVHIDNSLMFVIHEIWSRLARGEWDLRSSWQTQVFCVEEMEPVLLELGITKLDEALQVVLTALGAGGNPELSAAHGKEVIPNQVAVQQLVVPLVSVGHKAVVTGRHTGFGGSLGVFQVVTSNGVEVEQV